MTSRASNCAILLAVIGSCCVCTFADAANEGHAVTYYVSSSAGKDANDGRSPGSAWKTIGRVNSAPLGPGDSVLLKRGDLWRDQLIPVSGGPSGPVTYGAYGDGAKPRICGSVDRSYKADWRDIGNHIWETRDIPRDVGNIIFDEGKAVGVKVWSLKNVDQPNKFWYDKENGLVALYCERNPAVQYRSIECALTRYIVDESHRSYIIYTNLDLRYGGSHGIGGIGTSHIVVRDCDLSFIGGGLHSVAASGPVRYGNGIEFWDSARDNLVDSCRLWEIYDAALTNQGLGKNIQSNIRYVNNIIWNCEYSFEYWNRPEDSVTEEIYFENNTCVNAGHGWGHSQRPDPTGTHLMFYTNSAKTKTFVIRNNIFYQTSRDSEACTRLWNDWWAALTMDHNCWYQKSGPMMILPSGRHDIADFKAYQEKTGQDAHSAAADPLFADIDKHDFRPAADSPACRLGSNKAHTGALPCAGGR